MKLGFLTPYAPEWVDYAAANGFTCLELQTSPETALDPRTCNPREVKAYLDQKGITVSALACYFNHLEDGQETERSAYFRQVLELAPQLGASVVATMAGASDASRASGKIEDSLPSFKRIFSEHARAANDLGVKIAFENWPGGHPWPLVMNIAITPDAWTQMFDAVPDRALGLEYDPSHLVRLMIDDLEPLMAFKDRIYHVHAKDTTIRREVLQSVGYIGQGWWTYSIPSRGVVRWPEFFSSLRQIGYDGGVCIEHEDMDYWDDKFKDGLALGSQFLNKFIAA